MIKGHIDGGMGIEKTGKVENGGGGGGGEGVRWERESEWERVKERERQAGINKYTELEREHDRWKGG